jgi:hypothetical protein
MRFAPIFFSYGLVTVLYADETIKRWDGPKGGKISHGGNNIGNGDGGGLKIDTGGGDIGDIGVGGGGGGCNPDACDDKVFS